MKKYVLLASVLIVHFNLLPSADNKDAPFYSTVTGIFGAAVSWMQKKTGTKPISYCIDSNARKLYDNAERQIELKYGSDREQKKTKTYATLINDPEFVKSLKQLNDRAYFDWQHMLDAIKNDRYQDVHRFYKYNRVNASPCLRTAALLYLLQNKKSRESAPKPKDDGPRFNLQLLKKNNGYLESSVPKIAESDQDFPTLKATIRERSKELSITSPCQAAERRLRKSMVGAFSDAYLKDAQEVKKSAAVYAVYFAHLYSTYKVKNSIIKLFDNKDFINIYNQVWDRDSHLRARLQNQLSRGSLEACLIYDHHKLNICPIFAALVCDMALSNENKDKAPKEFSEMYLSGKKPYGKIIFMFLNSLNKKQKQILLAAKKEILETSSTNYSATIHSKITANNTQLELLGEIQAGKQVNALFKKLESSVIKTDYSKEAKQLINHTSSSSSSNAQSTPQNINTKNNLIITQNTMSNSSSPQKKDLVSLLSKVPENSIPDLLAAIELWHNSNPNNSNTTPTLKTQSQSSIHSNNNACSSSSSSSSSNRSSSSSNSKVNKRKTLKNQQSTSLPTFFNDYTPNSDNRDINSDNANVSSSESDTDTDTD